MDELINYLKNALAKYRKKNEVRKPDYAEFPIRRAEYLEPEFDEELYEFDAPGYDYYKLKTYPGGYMDETSEKNNVQRIITHYPSIQSDTLYNVSPDKPGSIYIGKYDPVYTNVKRQYEGTLPLLKRQGGKIVTVYK